MPAAHPEHLRAPVTTPRLKAGLALAWLVCTVFVVTKAVHIDDAAHLAIAEHIRTDPLHPMGGTVFWGEAPAPIHHLNQPHLFYYLLAGTLALTGGSLFAAHLLVALFTALCAFFAFRLGRALELPPAEATLGATLILLGPAFIPGQNLMTDVPMLAFWLAAFDSQVRERVWIAGLYVGLACLIKYTSLILVPILIIDAFVRGRRRAAWAAVVPVAILGAWSLFNLWDYGGVHLLGRPVDSARVGGLLSTIGVIFGRAGLFVLTLGACCPLTVGALPKTVQERGARRVALVVAAFLIFALLVGQGLGRFGPDVMRGEPIVLSLLRGVFALNGFYVLALAENARRRLRARGRSREATLLFIWLVLTALFVVVLSPFVAVRHVLLVVPAVVWLLLGGELVSRPRAALVVTAILGVIVAFGDARTASAYRDAAQRLADDGVTHFVGHWGFQYYAEEVGLTPYAAGETPLEPCDRLARPANVDQQTIGDEDRTRMTLVDEWTVDATLLDLPRTVTSRLGYYSVWHGVPYTFTLEPIDTFEIYEVDSAACAASSARGTESR